MALKNKGQNLKDTTKRVIIGIIMGCIIVYLIYLLSNGTIITNGNSGTNYFVYGLLFCIFLYYIFFYSIHPKYIKRNKLINTFMGLFIIYISCTLLLNSGENHIYYGDIFNIIGLILTIIGPTDLLISQKVKKEKDDKKMEVIEVK